MKDRFYGVYKYIRKKWYDWESIIRWIACSLEYLAIFVVVIFVFHYIFDILNLFYTDDDSARYILSTLIQSQAAIIAIVITLSLIVFQLSASAYSPRVVGIFRRNPNMWILLFGYSFSMIYNLIILKLVEDIDGKDVFRGECDIWSFFRLSSPFECRISFAVLLGIFTFVALFLYIWNITNLLKPEKIIKQLASEITNDEILNKKKDPIQPIEDIIRRSIMNHDFETIRVGLSVLTDRVIKIIDLNNEQMLSERFCKHLERISRLAVKEVDEEPIRAVITNLEKCGKATVEKKLENAIGNVASSLAKVGKVAVEKGKELENATLQAVLSLEAVGKYAKEEKNEDAASKIKSFLEEIEKAAMEKGKELEKVTQQIKSSLKKIE